MDVEREPFLRAVEASTGTLSTRIKERISVYDFAGRFVDLSDRGRGLCPFHDDHHASFSVNIEQHYWHCFAGCGGGSVVNFWMMYREVDFRTSICELAEILGLQYFLLMLVINLFL